LLFTIKDEDKDKLSDISQYSATKISIIGRITEEKAIRVYRKDGTVIEKPPTGYRHF